MNKTAQTILINYLASENIYMSHKEAEAAIKKWEAKYPKIDAISLAAIAISDPYETALSDSEIREIRNFYFPPKNLKETILKGE